MKFSRAAAIFATCLSKASAFSKVADMSALSPFTRKLDGHTVNENCNKYEIDFILVEGDSILTAVEGEIVDMLAEIGITVNTRMLTKEEYNAAETSGDFHLSFSETW